MKLVADAKNWWKWHSTYVFAIFAAFPIVWMQSPQLQAMLPARWVSIIAPIAAIIGFLLRMRRQVNKRTQGPK